MNNKEMIKNIAIEFTIAGHEIYEVGGSVRDELLGRIPSDFDFAVSSLPDETLRILDKFCSENTGYAVYSIGKEYGTIGLVDKNGIKMEFTTYRGEVYPTNSRKPNVVFGNSIVEDLARRDFTINAIARDATSGEYLDPFDGEGDINRKVIKCVGSDDRLDEDPLRMLRAYRFGAQLGFAVEVEIKHPERLKIISAERIRDELNKILLSENATIGIAYLYHTKLIDYIIPELLELVDLEQGHSHIHDAFNHTLSVLARACGYDVGEDKLILRLAALLHDIGKKAAHTVTATGPHFYGHHNLSFEIAGTILRRLKYDGDTIERVTNLVHMHMEPIMMLTSGSLNKRSVSRLIRRMNATKHDDMELLLKLSTCDVGSTARPRVEFIDEMRRLVKECQEVLPEQKSPLTGYEIMLILNIKPGTLIGDIKDFLIEQVIEGNVKAEDKESLTRMVKEYNGKDSISSR